MSRYDYGPSIISVWCIQYSLTDVMAHSSPIIGNLLDKPEAWMELEEDYFEEVAALLGTISCSLLEVNPSLV